MHIMAGFRRDPQSKSLVAFCFLLSLCQGCARSEPQHQTAAASPVSEQSLPFHPDTGHGSAGDAGSPDPNVASGLPFPAMSHPRLLPSGTLLTVQLEDSLAANKARPGDTFTAFVAAPLTIDGDTLLQRGTPVSGRVESAQSQTDRPGLASDLHYAGSGYLRLTLSAINVKGRQLAVQTSSLFARGAPQLMDASSGGSTTDPVSRGVKVQKGRRLTFRLTAPVVLDDPSSMANGQDAGPSSE
jgi:hypothetical protein